MVDAGEDVEQRPLARRGEPHAAGRDRRHAERARRGSTSASLSRFFVAAQMALQLDVDAGRGRTPRPGDRAVRRRRSGGRRAPRGRRARPGRRSAVELLERQRAFAFRRAQLHARDQAAEIAVASGDSQRTGSTDGRMGGIWPEGVSVPTNVRIFDPPDRPAAPAPCLDRQLRADDRLDTGARRPCGNAARRTRRRDRAARRRIPESAARSTSASGSDAPCRKLKAEAV